MSTLLELSTVQVVLLALSLAIGRFVYSYRDYRALGTRPRPDLVPFPNKQTYLLGDLLAVWKDRKFYLGRFWNNQQRHAHLLRDEKGRADPSKAFTVTLPGIRMILINQAEVSTQPALLGCAATDQGRSGSISPTYSGTLSITTRRVRCFVAACSKSSATASSSSMVTSGGTFLFP